ncbi:MAG TPA: IS21 family transposase [Syntrophales bacterium]|nr:IS21 family transposase [Syntrophales bacterium]HLE17768.1 IS21 family transposase [Syntrophales bacterium]
MIERRIVFEIHRLKDAGYSARWIARELRLGRETVKQYLAHPERTVLPRKPRASKLDPYREMIDGFLAQAPHVKAPVILQRLKKEGFDGKATIVRSHLQKKREEGRVKWEAFIRFESAAGKQLQIDWGHFGSLTYGTARRKLYALAVIEAYSRMLYVEFTHSQKQEALHQGLLNAFRFFNGTTEEVVVDNMLTAVTERCGSVIRFNDAFLDFLRVFKIVPHACNIRAPQEKGKIEKSIDYLRHNFWPLRTFTDLDDVQRQVNHWRDTVCNVRIHQTTGERPLDRFSRVKNLRPLPPLLPDCRETASLLVHQDFAVRFDDNSYTAPPWATGRYITLKADQTTVTLYHKQKQIAAHHRTWERKQRIELAAHREQVEKFHRKLWQDRDIALLSSLGQEAIDYLAGLAETRLPIKKNAAKLLELKDQYSVASLIDAIKKALAHRAYGADYIENILRQEHMPKKNHPPVKLKNDELNNIRLQEPSLADYDAYILKRRKE